MPSALRLYQSCLRFISFAHAIVSVQALGRVRVCARTRGDCMGKSQPTWRLPDAAGRRAAHRLVARLPVTFGRLLSHEGGATAIEYGLIVACVTLAILGGMTFFAGN